MQALGQVLLESIASGGGGGNIPSRGTLTGSLNGLTSDERRMVDELLNQGRNVEILRPSNIPNVGTPDFRVDGVLTELKTLHGTSLNTHVTRIQQGFDQGA